MTNPIAFDVMQTGLSRVHLVRYGVGPSRQPTFHNHMALQGLGWSLGDITKIEVPSATKWDEFDEVGEVKGEKGRPTSSLEGKYPANIESYLGTLAREGCPTDMLIAFGPCTDPRVYNGARKLLFLNTSNFTNYGTDPIGSLTSGDRSEVMENADFSMRAFYEILPLVYGEKAGDVVTNEVVDLIVCDTPECGGLCGTPSDGCQVLFGVTLAAGGSVATPADIIFSIDGGKAWYAHDIETLSITENPTAVGCIGVYVVVFSNDSGSLHYALLSEFDTVTDPTFTEITTGFVAGGEPNAVVFSGTKLIVAGDGGYIYECEDPTAGVTALHDGSVLTDDLNAVHALSDRFIIAVGNASAILKTENGEDFSEVVPPTGVGVNYNTVWILNEQEWFIGASNGNLYYTVNGGTTWSTKPFPGSGSGVVRDIKFANKAVGFLAHDTTAPRGRIFKTVDGGYSWTLEPQGDTLTLNDRINVVAPCQHDVNFIAAAGLGDNGSDGIVLIGKD